jgi:hypothetical protein
LKAERKERLDASGNEGLEETNMVTLEQDIVKVVFFLTLQNLAEKEKVVFMDFGWFILRCFLVL